MTGARRSLAWGLAIAWAAAIWALSSIPASRLPAVGIWNFDKLAHAVVFGVLALLLRRALAAGRAPRARDAGIAIAVAGLWGVLDEIHQRFVPGRFSSAYDLIADVVGALVAVGIAVRLRPS